jgi:hypothetical protein
MAAANSLFALLILLLLGVLIYGPWQGVCTDYARQIMFEKRDAIFDLAREGKLSFQSREYREIRSLLEKSIRFAHEATLPNLVVILGVFLWRREKIEKPALLTTIDGIKDAETRKRVLELVNQALNALVLMTILKSPTALILLAVALIPLLALLMIARVARRCLRFALACSRQLMQFEAERVGSAADALVG